MELADGLEESDERRRWPSTRGCCSSTTPGGWAWTRGGEALAAEAEEIATAARGPALAGPAEGATAARPGVARTADWLAAAAKRSARRPGRRPALRVAVRGAGAYAYMCAGDFDGFEAALDEVLELTGGDRSVGAGIVLGSPVAWGLMGKGWCCASATDSTRPRSCSSGAANRAERRRPRDRELGRGDQAAAAGRPRRRSRRRWRWRAATAS